MKQIGIWLIALILTLTALSITYAADDTILYNLKILKDYGIDTDSDGKFDYLAIDANITFPADGNYKIITELSDSQNNLITMHTESSQFTAGEKILKINLSGIEIYANKINGSYKIHMIILKDNTQPVSYPDIHSTAPYKYTDFQKSYAYFTGEFKDSGVDQNSDGFYDYLNISAKLNITKPGKYIVSGILLTSNDADDISNNPELHLTISEPGIYNANILFSGVRIYQFKTSGKYTSKLRIEEEVELKDSDKQTKIHYVMDTYTYTTSEYNSDKFQKPYVMFTGKFSEKGIDQDKDGKFSRVAANVEINVSSERNYLIKGIFGAKLIDIESRQEANLKSGIQNISMVFDGKKILDSGKDGPYLLYVEISAIGENYVESTVYNTASYKYTDFEPYNEDVKINSTTFNGETTDFSAIPDLNKAANIVLDKVQYGKIDFGSNVINLSGSLDLDKYVAIDNNIVGIDTSIIPQLNKSAKITMRGLGFSNMPILYYSDGFGASSGRICTADICSNPSYNAATGTLTFDASHFSTFWTVKNSTSKLKISEVDVEVDSDDSNNLHDKDKIGDDAKPGSTLVFSIKLKNLFTKAEGIKLTDVSAKIFIKDLDDGSDIDETSEEVDIKTENDEVVEIRIDVPMNVDAGTYDVEITAEGRDDVNDETHDDSIVLYLDVKKDKHNVAVDKFSVSPDVISCTRSVSFIVQLANIGSNDEDDISYTIKNSALGINLHERGISIDEGTEDNVYKRTLISQIDSDVPDGIYTLDFEAEFRNGNKLSSKSADLTVQTCSALSSAERNIDTRQAGINADDSGVVTNVISNKVEETPVTDVSIGNGRIYFIMFLLFLVIILTVFILFLAFLKKRRRY